MDGRPVKRQKKSRLRYELVLQNGAEQEQEGDVKQSITKASVLSLKTPVKRQNSRGLSALRKKSQLHAEPATTQHKSDTAPAGVPTSDPQSTPGPLATDPPPCRPPAKYSNTGIEAPKPSEFQNGINKGQNCNE
jgi:hypothetical protein